MAMNGTGWCIVRGKRGRKMGNPQSGVQPTRTSPEQDDTDECHDDGEKTQACAVSGKKVVHNQKKKDKHKAQAAAKKLRLAAELKLSQQAADDEMALHEALATNAANNAHLIQARGYTFEFEFTLKNLNLNLNCNFHFQCKLLS